MPTLDALRGLAVVQPHPCVGCVHLRLRQHPHDAPGVRRCGRNEFKGGDGVTVGPRIWRAERPGWCEGFEGT